MYIGIDYIEKIEAKTRKSYTSGNLGAIEITLTDAKGNKYDIVINQWTSKNGINNKLVESLQNIKVEECSSCGAVIK
jgi:hypothetical protein